jgi:biotin carboxylase
MNERKKLLLIDSGDGAKSFIFEMISHHDVELFLAAPKAQPWMDSLFDEKHRIMCDVYDYAVLENEVATFVTNETISFDGIGTYYDFFVTQAAKLAEKYDCVQISPEAAGRSSANKFLMRETCKDKGVPMPRYELVRSADRTSLETHINNFGFPCVVKPIIGSKSYGVKKFERTVTSEDLEELFNLTSVEEKELFKNFTQDFLIEAYLEGMVVSVDGFVQNGVISFAGIIEFAMGPEPHFTQEGNYIPARIPEVDSIACFTYATDVIRALEFDNCGFHGEFRITPEGPRLIEIACRLPGGPLQLGYARAFGYNLASNLVDIWLGIPTTLTKLRESHIAQKAIFHHDGGTITAINTPETPTTEAGVWDYVAISSVGESIVTYPSIPKPLYFYAVEGKTADELSVREAMFERKVRFTIA